MREAERALALTELAPLDAIRRLVEFKFDYCREHPTIIPLLAGENMHGGTYVKRSRKLREMHHVLVDMIQRVLEAGEKEGTIRPGIGVDRDIVAQMQFKPAISTSLKEMDARIFRPEPMRLADIIAANPRPIRSERLARLAQTEAP
jgi:hypothetical protein